MAFGTSSTKPVPKTRSRLSTRRKMALLPVESVREAMAE